MAFLDSSKKLITRVVRLITRAKDPIAPHIRIGDVAIGRAHPCFFVAEIGINHNGSVAIAKQLIDASAEAGAQAVKFQKRTIPVFYSQEELDRVVPVNRAVLENAVARGVLPEASVKRLLDSDYADTRRGDYVWAREFTEPEYREIFAYAKEKGLLCFASPWDLESVDFLEKLDPPCHKIASACLTHDELLKKIKATNRPVILSTGMSTVEEVEKAVSLLGTDRLVLLHTVSAYPSEDSDANVRSIVKLRKKYPMVPIGYSGHERGTVPSLAAATIGANLIERHITLDKKMFGTDQAASLEPHEFAQLVRDVRTIRAAYGDGAKRLLPAEVASRQHLRKV